MKGFTHLSEFDKFMRVIINKEWTREEVVDYISVNRLLTDKEKRQLYNAINERY